MASRYRAFCSRLLGAPQGDVVAVGMLLLMSGLYAWLTWARCWPPFTDRSWYMQVAARVAAGEVLYRDMLWIYGPLPVYVLALLYRLLTANVGVYLLLGQVLAALACLLTYRSARFLLSVPFALLGTVALLVGGFWGGFLCYIETYTGAVSLGAVLGLCCVVSLLSYLKNRNSLWLVAAGVATGGALLTKVEFAFACLGTVLLALIWIVIHPEGLAISRVRGMRALGIYVIVTVVVGGVGYSLMAYHAGWSYVWSGISDYQQAGLIISLHPPWGTLESWCYALSGLGIYLLTGLVPLVILTPTALQRRTPAVCALMLFCLGLIALPWLLTPDTFSSIMSGSRPFIVKEAIKLIWAPTTLLATALIVALGIRWSKAYRSKRAIGPREWFFAVLLLYSALAAARFYFNPLIDLLPNYVDTLFPVLVFSAVTLVPWALERRGPTGLRRFPAQLFVAAILLVYAAAGFYSDLRMISRVDLELTSPRGTVRIPPETGWQATVVQYIIENTQPNDTIAVLDFAPGFYFLSGRRNALRQDLVMPGIGSSPADAEEIVGRLEANRTRLVVVPQWVEESKTWWWARDAGPRAYENLMPVWQYVHDHYAVRTVVAGVYAMYERTVDSP